MLTPYSSNFIEITSGSNAILKIKKAELHTPYDSNINTSGSFYNWSIENKTPYESNIIDWEDDIYNLTKEYIKPYLSNTISITSASYYKLDPNIFLTYNSDINTSGSFYNWKLTKS